MKSVIYACFDSKEAVMQTVEALMQHGVRAEDITLILPQTPGAEQQEKPPAHVQPEIVTAPKHDASSIVLGGEEGAGVGFGLGLLTAMCIPGIGFIAGSGAIVVSLVAAGTAIGGVSGGIYGYLVQRETPHSIAEAMSSHVSSGGATLSVTAADDNAREDTLIIINKFGGRIVPHDE